MKLEKELDVKKRKEDIIEKMTIDELIDEIEEKTKFAPKSRKMFPTLVSKQLKTK